MPVTSVMYGAARDGKHADAFRRCLNLIRANQGQSCLYVVCSDARVQQLRQRALREMGGCFHFPVATFPAFANALYRTHAGRKRLLGGLEQAIFLEDLLRRHADQFGAILHAAPLREYPGMMAKLLEFLLDVRRVGLHSPDALTERFQQCHGRQRGAYHALVALLRLYNDALDDARVTDQPGVFLELAERAAAGTLDVRVMTPTPELFVLEGADELPEPDQQIVAALCAQFEQTLLTLDMPFSPYHFPETDRAFRQFHLLRGICGFIRRLGCSALPFAPAALPVSAAPPDFVTIRASANRSAEVADIAGAIRALWREQAVSAFREIGVAFPSLETYAPLIREIFPRCGVPFALFHGYPLAASPVTAALFRLLRIALNDYSYEAIRAFFASPLVEIAPQDANLLALDAATFPTLDLLIRQRKIAGNKAVWVERLTEYQREIEAARAAHDVWPVEYALISALFALFDCLTPMDAEQRISPVDGLTWLLDMTQRLRMPQRILRAADRGIREQEFAALQRLRAALSLLRQELQASARPAVMTLQEFFDLLQLTAQAETYYVRQESADAVWVLDARDARRVEFRHLFFGGLAEKDFPGQDMPSVFLSEQDAERVGLPTFADKLAQTAYLFYLIARNPADRLHLSYPRQEDEQDLLPSTYIERLRGENSPFGKSAEWVSSSPESLPAIAPSQEGTRLFQAWEGLFTAADLAQMIGRTLVKPGDHGEAARVRAALDALTQERGAAHAAHFLNAMRGEHRRRARQLTEFDGMLAARWAKDFLSNRYRRHVYGAAEFDAYARCPMSLLFQQVLDLAPLPRIEDDAAAVTLGALVHAILFRFYADSDATRRGEADDAFLRRAAQGRAWLLEAQTRLAAAARDELAAHDLRGVFWNAEIHALLAGLPGASEAGQAFAADLKGVFAAFLDEEARRVSAWRPRYLNASFGMADSPGYRLSAEPCRLRGRDEETARFMGRIDRIDMACDAQGAAAPQAALFDYKTGSVPSLEDIKAFRHFHLPLALLALRDALGGDGEVVGGAYYQVHSPEKPGRKSMIGVKMNGNDGKGLFETPEEFFAFLQECADRAIEITQNMQAGRFHPTTLGAREAKCGWCDYRQICRVDHQRMAAVLSSE